MSALQSVLLDWDVSRVYRVITAGLAIYLSLRITDGFLSGLGLVIVLAIVLEIPWEVAKRISDR